MSSFDEGLEPFEMLHLDAVEQDDPDVNVDDISEDILFKLQLIALMFAEGNAVGGRRRTRELLSRAG